MEQNQTPLARAQRQVIEGEAQAMLQAARLGELVYLGNDTTGAEAALADLEDKLCDLYARLELEWEQVEAARRQR